MRIKSYFATSVSDAMEKARKELGPDCMLLNSKKTELELRSLGAYEVVFAVPPEPARAGAAHSSVAMSTALTATPAASEALGGSREWARELAELRKQIETVKRSVDRRPLLQQPTAAGLSPSGERLELAERLSAADLSDELANELLAAAENRLARGGSADSLELAWRAECQERLRFSPTLGASSESPRAVLLVGPAGVGKTTTLVKLAIRYGLRARLPLQLLSLDSLRVGAWEQLAAYARIAGLPCDLLHTPAALDQAFTEYGHKKLLLIDTPGFSPANDSQSRALATWLAARTNRVEVHLVLSAAAHPRTNLRAVERFKALSPSKILFTHLDEAVNAGPLLETALRAELPVSFLADGQQVPEDLQEATFERLLGALDTGSQESRRIASAA